ncbi:T3SS effector HopA1 family protein [Streptomyces sp. NBC_01275]|uniref:T3SS effector HopA1 family protein n=1 Tax=Streptomyces sp. NBC_01275 TaxID=2903807 RepID=UPI002253562D|nr:T3SS effector HopA1 family protein [Streptomyces sp. NBC_01275]MCX4762870.1 T3SS effector HopA1 family protein [Streptomyces sp. NBC_01275]
MSESPVGNPPHPEPTRPEAAHPLPPHPPSAPLLSARLREALDRVTVAPDRSRARVDDREVEADSPREMRRLLAEALYDILHAGQFVEKGALSFRLRDEAFERVLGAAVPHERSTARARVHIPPAESDGTAARALVERDGVRVWVPAGSVREAAPLSAGQVVTLDVPARRPALSPGFFVVDGSLPRSPHRELLRVYVHVTRWEDAAPVWARALGHLEEQGVAYRSKILSAKALYPRRDALVVYLGQESWQRVPGLAEALREAPGVGQETSVFAEPVAPGVAVAREPEDDRPGMSGLSFGQHRATALAHALLDSAADGTPVEQTVVARFTEAGIDPARPAHNSASPEFPAAPESPQESNLVSV